MYLNETCKHFACEVEESDRNLKGQKVLYREIEKVFYSLCLHPLGAKVITLSHFGVKSINRVFVSSVPLNTLGPWGNRYLETFHKYWIGKYTCTWKGFDFYVCILKHFSESLDLLWWFLVKMLAWYVLLEFFIDVLKLRPLWIAF